MPSNDTNDWRMGLVRKHVDAQLLDAIMARLSFADGQILLETIAEAAALDNPVVRAHIAPFGVYMDRGDPTTREMIAMLMRSYSPSEA